MAKQVIRPAGAPPTSNPLSPAVVVGGFVFVSGQTAAGVSGIEAQTRSVLERLAAILRAAGSDLAHVVRCGVYLTDISNVAQMNAVYREFFPHDPPARSTIGCALAAPGLLVEIDCVAGIPSHDGA